MTNLLLRENLYEDLFDFRRDFDRIFNRILIDKPYFKEEIVPNAFNFLPAVETWLDKETHKFVVRMALPGIEPKDVDVRTKGNLLIIKGERKAYHTTKELEMFLEEFVYGNFERTINLPEGVMTDKINALYLNGVLEVTIPITVAALPHKVEIKTFPVAKTVNA